jgi:hypothetical protein
MSETISPASIAEHDLMRRKLHLMSCRAFCAAIVRAEVLRKTRCSV